jgi:ribonuclease HI
MDTSLFSSRSSEQAEAASALVINVDGGARGNPGIAGYGALVRDLAGNTVAELSEFIGVATNNVAEYRGLLAGLEYAKACGAKSVKVFSDSELVVKQVKGLYKVKSPDLKPLVDHVLRLASSFPAFSIHHVPRERNADADRLANLAMDRAGRGGFGQVKTTPTVPIGPVASSSENEQTFRAVVTDGILRPTGRDGPVLEEGQKYEVRIRKARG